jgi:integrase
MGQKVKSCKLDTKTARKALKPRAKPYKARIREGLHLGYRRNLYGGEWVAIRYLGAGAYKTANLVKADDFKIDGELISFDRAQELLLEWACEREQAPQAASAGPFTVDDALDAYFAHLEAEGSKSLTDASQRASSLIRPALGTIAIKDLTREQITDWRNKIAVQPRLVRGKKGEASRLGSAAASEDEIRRRKATANRTLTILRAALNFAFRSGKVESDSAWRAVKGFREVETARVRHFSIDECRRLVNAAQGSFRDLINAALFTGCRYGELCALRVRDFNPDSGTLFVAKSKSGKARHVVLTEEGQAFFRRITLGRQGAPRRAHGRRPSIYSAIDGWPRGGFYYAREARHSMGSDSSNSADAASLQECEHQTRDLSYSPPHLCKLACDGGRASGRRCAKLGPR